MHDDVQNTINTNILAHQDRMSEDKAGGWRDCMWNCRFIDDVSGHIFEIQIHHKDMLVVRKQLGGHKIYAEYRGMIETLEVAGLELEDISVSAQLENLVKKLTVDLKRAMKNKK